MTLSKDEVRKRLMDGGLKDYEADAVIEIVRGEWTEEDVQEFLELLGDISSRGGNAS